MILPHAVRGWFRGGSCKSAWVVHVSKILVKRRIKYIHTYINFISIRIVNSTIVLVSPNTINKLRNQIYCNNYI